MTLREAILKYKYDSLSHQTISRKKIKNEKSKKIIMFVWSEIPFIGLVKNEKRKT